MLKPSNCDKTKKTQIVTKLKNSNCDKTKKLKLWQNSKTQIVLKTQMKTKLKNSRLSRTVEGGRLHWLWLKSS